MGIKPRGDIVNDQLVDVFTDGLERVPVREHQVIGDNDKGENAQ